MRVLVANSPRMYRESLALAIQRHRPYFEVLVADPEDLGEEVERFGPQVLVRDDGGAGAEAPEGVICWVGILIDDHLNAWISVNGRVSEIHDVYLEEVISALDEAEEFFSADGERKP